MDSFNTLYYKSSKQHSTVKALLNLLKFSPTCTLLWISPLLPIEHESLQSLLAIVDRVTLSNRDDHICWLPSGGPFSMSTSHKFLFPTHTDYRTSSAKWRLIWSLRVPPKVTIFLWKLLWGVLPCNLFLSHRIRDLNPQCTWCNQAEESIAHIFW